METYKFLRKVFFRAFLFSIFSLGSIGAQAEWTILIYAQAKNNLSRFASKNFTDLASVGSNQKVNILVQWYQPKQTGTWRYKINKNNIELDSVIQTNTDGNKTSDLVDSMRWAKNKYPAQKYALVLWNHGVGILDPVWNGRSWINVPGRNLIPNDSYDDESLFDAKGFELMDMAPSPERGILFNDQTRTYMKNQELVSALKQIKEKVLGNKKIDLFGMDACLMAMIEVCYQSRKYAKYLVASQEVELAYGWNYLSLAQLLAQGNISPISLATSIVAIYDAYYQRKIPFYTQSAIDLENITHLKDNLDNMSALIEQFKTYDSPGIKKVIRNARKKSIQFSTQTYVDLYSFYNALSYELSSKYATTKTNIEKRPQPRPNNRPRKKARKTHSTQILSGKAAQIHEQIKEQLRIGMGLIEHVVIAKASGSKYKNAQGLSIYFPTKFIAASYHKTEFAKESLWVNFLRSSIK